MYYRWFLSILFLFAVSGEISEPTNNGKVSLKSPNSRTRDLHWIIFQYDGEEVSWFVKHDHCDRRRLDGDSSSRMLDEVCEPCEEHSDCGSEQYPDPHFRTWSGTKYDYHGECDMVHVTNDHLDMHIRTKAHHDHSNGFRWSTAVAAALRFDSDILEVFVNAPPTVNGNQVSSGFTLDGIYPVEVTPKQVKVTLSGGQHIEFITNEHHNLILRIDAHGSDFFQSQGMAGTWDQSGLIGRDRTTSFNNTILYADEWEVDDGKGDPILFSSPPTDNCMSIALVLEQEFKDKHSHDHDRRMEDVERAAEICDRVVMGDREDLREDCIFDVIVSGFDKKAIDNPAYVDPFKGIKRCVAAPEESIPGEGGSATCEELGGKCVYRCNTAKSECRSDLLCVQTTDLAVIDAARRRLRPVDFVEGCSCALPKKKTSKEVVVKEGDGCMDDLLFEFTIGDGSSKTCAWLKKKEGRTEKYCETKGYDPYASSMIKFGCRGTCADYLSECM